MNIKKIYFLLIVLQPLGAGRFELNASERVALLQVAVQCLYTGGDAVLEAQHLYNALSGAPVVFNHAVLCGEEKSVEQRHHTATGPSMSKILLVPNPARDAVRVLVPDAASDVSIRVELIDQRGRMQRNILLSNGMPVSLDGLLPGLYFCRVTLPDNRVQTLKLVVLR